jgi:methyl-accepting chemotaxis protein
VKTEIEVSIVSSIRIRMSLALTGMIAALALAIISSIWTDHAATKSLQEGLIERVIPLRDLKAISDAYAVDIVDTSHKVRGGSLSFAEGSVRITASRDIVREKWKSYLSSVSGADETRLAQEAQASMTKTNDAIESILKIMKGMSKVELETYNDTRLYPTIEPTTLAIDKLVNWQIVESEMAAQKATTSSLRNKIILAFVAVLGTLMCILAAWVTFSLVVTPLNRLTKRLSTMGQGDMETAVPEIARRDEIGTMARVVDDMRQKIRALRETETARLAQSQTDLQSREGLITSIRGIGSRVAETTRRVKGGATIMTTACGSMQSTAHDTLTRSEAARTALQGNTDTIRSMATATSQLSASIHELSVQGGRILQSVEQMTGRTQDAATRLGALEAVSDKATSAVDLISQIAEQTNLLALNATIEAARAGDAGRGFGVVASEVKALASQAARASDEIRQMINAMLNSVGSVQTAMHEVDTGMSDLRAVAASVKEAVDEQSRATSSISHSIDESSQVAESILSEVETMNGSAAQTGKTALEVMSVLEELSSVADSLARDVDAFGAQIKAA